MRKYFSQPAVAITFITAVVTALLAFFKLGVGYSGNSHALLADGVHSLADLLIDILVLLAAHFGSQQADENHPYGHGRIETAATLGLASILILAGAGILGDAGMRLWFKTAISSPDTTVLWVAIVAIVVNEILFLYTLKFARRLNSSLLEANAWHTQSDVAVSCVVLLSIVGALWGFPYLDAIGAILVGIMIIKLGAELAWRSISELVDTGVDPKTLEKIRNTIKEVSGVETLHHLRTRTSKNTILVDVHILVSPYISVSEGHFIGDQVITALYKEIPEVTDITVHVDSEDDEVVHPCVMLPSRTMLTELLMQCWHALPGAHQLRDIRLHYLNGKIDVEIVLPLRLLADIDVTVEQLSLKYREAICELDYINQLDLLLHV